MGRGSSGVPSHRLFRSSVTTELFLEDEDWKDILGPVLTPGQVCEQLGISPTDLKKITDTHQIVGIVTSEDKLFYPEWNFVETDILTGLPVVLSEFDYKIVDMWTLTGWLLCPQLALHGKSVIQYLQEGLPDPDEEPVIRIAMDQALYYTQHKRCFTS